MSVRREKDSKERSTELKYCSCQYAETRSGKGNIQK